MWGREYVSSGLHGLAAAKSDDGARTRSEISTGVRKQPALHSRFDVGHRGQDGAERVPCARSWRTPRPAALGLLRVALAGQYADGAHDDLAAPHELQHGAQAKEADHDDRAPERKLADRLSLSPDEHRAADWAEQDAHEDPAHQEAHAVGDVEPGLLEIHRADEVAEAHEGVRQLAQDAEHLQAMAIPALPEEAPRDARRAVVHHHGVASRPQAPVYQLHEQLEGDPAGEDNDD
mmetsp:Transcript_14512/g.28337  ORF Transcript_14512/g.28337 Transcript_14512/m.28337 type:complete len:234 (-) Transcript_14512:351-1052(-)